MVDKFEIGDKVHFCYLDAHNELFQPELTNVFDQEGIVVAILEDDSLAVKFENKTFELCIDWVDFVARAKKPWNGKVICVNSANGHFTKGKIYKVKNGLLLDDNGVAYFSDYKYYECPADDCLKPAATDFIEFKGFANE